MIPTIDINCPKCGRVLKVKLDHFSSGHSRRCPRCSTRIEFTGNGGRKAARELRKLDRQMKRLFK